MLLICAWARSAIHVARSWLELADPPSAIKDKNKSLLRLSRYSQFFIDRSFEFLPEDRVFRQRLHVGLALRETEYRKIKRPFPDCIGFSGEIPSC